MGLGLWSFAPQNLSLLTLLLTTLGTSALGVLYPNLITQPNRSHNTEKLLNEIFARQHLAYAGFYLSVMVVAKFQTPNEWLSRLLGLFVVFSLLLFGLGLKITTNHDSKVAAHHYPCPKENCKIELPYLLRFRIFGINAMLSAINLAMAVGTAANSAIGN